MATVFGNGIDLKDTELLNALLRNVKLAEATDAPEPGDLRLVGGVPHYVNAQGIVRPVHEDSLTNIESDGPITFDINGRTATAAIAEATATTPGVLSAADKARLDASMPISQVVAPLGVSTHDDGTQTLVIAPADGTNPGTLSPEHYGLLAGATIQNIPNTLILRGDPNVDGPTNLGNVSLDYLEGGNISVQNISCRAIYADQSATSYFGAIESVSLNSGLISAQQVTISAAPTADDHATPRLYVDSAIASSIDVLDTGVSAITGIGAITATPPDEDGVVEVSIAPADAQSPGTLSPEQFSLLAEVQDRISIATAPYGGRLTVEDIYGSVRFSFVAANNLNVSGYAQADGLGITNSISTGSIYIEGVDTTNPQSGTTVGYVDSAIATATQDLAASVGGRDWKESVLFAYKANISLSAAPPSQGGVTVPVGGSVLLMGQTTSAENGCRVWNGAQLVRRTDSSAGFLSAGATYIVEAGDYANDRYQLTTANFVLDTDPLTFTDATDATIASDGLDQDGRIIRVKGVPDQISVTPDGVGISTTYAGGGSITTLGTITQGTWKGNILGIAYGGSGASNAIDARTNLVVYSKLETDAAIQNAIANNKYAANIGNGIDTVFNIAHGLNDEDVTVFLRERVLPGEAVYTDVKVVDANTVRFSFGSPPANSEFRCIIKK